MLDQLNKVTLILSNRDDFSAATRRTLAARAGHKCSVCSKPTSGPGDTANSVRSDGIAAHILAASPKGPRYDATLSPEARRSTENGIWGCTQHGREIDIETSTFTTDVLRGLKRIRETEAAKELQHLEATADHSGILIEFPHVTTQSGLFEVLAPQDYTFATTAGIRDLFQLADRPPRLLEIAPDVIVETWDSHPHIAGILSTLLCANVDHWKPRSAVLDKLERSCTTAINSNEWTRVAVVEPLAFAVAAQGRPDAHKRLLERLLADTRWRSADFDREHYYYGGVGVQIAAILRHWRDPYRKGLLRANDVARLITLLLPDEKILVNPSGRRMLLDLLAAHAKVLHESGARDLAKIANEYAEAFRGRTTPLKLPRNPPR